MIPSRSYIGLALAAALLASCGDRASPLPTTVEPGPVRAKGANSQRLIRMTFPGDFPGVPGYARVEDRPPHVYIVDGLAVIAFYRNPNCVRPDFNLLELFDVPAAFGCAPTVEGFALYEPGDFPAGAPKVVHATGTGAVPFWFAPAAAIEAAMTDGELTIGELAALDGLLVGYATHFTEMLHPNPEGVISGGHPNHKLIQTAHGTLVDGRRFQYHLTEIGGEVRSIGLRIR
jgi:hypothetical protein